MAKLEGFDTQALTWRVLVDRPAVGSRNMALDHALAACLETGEAVLRIYRWSVPTVSLGRNELARDHYDLNEARRAGIQFVRRPTGGRAVLHDRELTYAVALPIRPGVGPKTAYELINRGLVEAMCSLGVPATMAADRGFYRGLESGPCFDEPAPGEVTVAGRKLVGSAQARIGGAILQHGSVLIGPGQERLLALASTLAGVGAGESGAAIEGYAPVKPAVSLEEALGRAPSWSHLVEAVIAGLSGATGGDFQPGELTEAERAKTMELTERYSSAEWTWRR